MTETVSTEKQPSPSPFIYVAPLLIVVAVGALFFMGGGKQQAEEIDGNKPSAEVKLGVYWAATARLVQGHELDAPVRWVNQLGKWSMLDVFVMAVLDVAVKGLPGGSRVEIELGAAAFCASVLLSIYISLHITKTSAAPTEP